MSRGLRRGSVFHDDAHPVYLNPAVVTLVPLRGNRAEAIQQQAAEAAEELIERLFAAALDLRRLLTTAGSELAAQRLRVAIDQLDDAINETFAAALDRERPPC
jgi:hypothetical protein